MRLQRFEDLIQQKFATYAASLTLLPVATATWAATCYTAYINLRAQRNTTEGVAIGGMQKILPWKIEELTLQMIALGKENSSHKQHRQSLQQQLTEK